MSSIVWTSAKSTFSLSELSTENIFGQKKMKILRTVDKHHILLLRLCGSPWSSGYGRRLMFKRSWVPIPAPDGHFAHVFVVKIGMMFI